MQKYETLELQILERGVATVILNRPNVHNAMNDRMIRELTDVFEHLTRGDEIRLVCLKANGLNFCAGADLNWMRSVKDKTYEENHSGSIELYNMFETIKKCRHPVLSSVQGSVYGGGLGLLAVSDYVITDSQCNFCFSELKLGLLPATISPVIIEKIGYSAANALFLSARLFDADYALTIGLTHQVSKNLDLDTPKLIQSFLKTAPQASVICKKMARDVSQGLSDPRKHTTTLITTARMSLEGQEGIQAVLDKRTPQWVKTDK
jgi:methylglutaconyl-CoA hydratase